MKDLFTGDLVHLTAEDPETLAKLVSQWMGDSEYSRLLNWDPATVPSVKGVQKWIEKQFEDDKTHSFAIRTLEGDAIIGEIGIDGINWTHGDAFVGIGLGDREYWGRGFGTDAMRIIERYAFTELNLHRLTLDVFEYNPRGIRSYEKAGFHIEGRERGVLMREGRRWDLIFMGILREEWLAQNRREDGV